MHKTNTVYENAVTTHRSAESLARAHGFESVAELAEQLPEYAKVIDVGAGASPFGVEVAKLRPDITWVNFDYSYGADPEILKEVSIGAPSNVEYVAGDATKLTDVYEPETFDAVFSYWLLPHMSLDEPGPARAAAEAMYKVTKIGGRISIGSRNDRLRRLFGGKDQYNTESGSSEEFADKIVAGTKLSKSASYLQKLINETATPFFGTSRYAKREGKQKQIYDPKAGEYIPLSSKEGVKIRGRLAIELAKRAYINKRRK
ncbi:class I SAM-dependent methyltransferase [Candidatus Nomurabacteria bacterium]|nr:class I SAM-dependent methyltransferase [Candidatus Nomurabacteria bacterium]